MESVLLDPEPAGLWMMPAREKRRERVCGLPAGEEESFWREPGAQGSSISNKIRLAKTRDIQEKTLRALC